MKKVKQILAILGIVLILGINILLVVTAFGATEDNNNIFNAAIVTVILVPVLLWIYLYVFKLIKKNAEDKQLKEERAEEEE
jgi:membrane protein YdbS with pleckstrin-like domain